MKNQNLITLWDTVQTPAVGKAKKNHRKLSMKTNVKFSTNNQFRKEIFVTELFGRKLESKLWDKSWLLVKKYTFAIKSIETKSTWNIRFFLNKVIRYFGIEYSAKTRKY